MRKALVIILVIIAAVGGAMIGYNIFNTNLTMIYIGLGLIGFGVIGEILMGLIPEKNLVKNRTKFSFDVIDDPKKIEPNLRSFLEKNGFKEVEYAGEKVYRKGLGLFIARKFISYKVENMKVELEAWVSSGLGNTPTIELPLDTSFYGSLPKSALMKTIKELQAHLTETK